MSNPIAYDKNGKPLYCGDEFDIDDRRYRIAPSSEVETLPDENRAFLKAVSKSAVKVEQ